MTRGRTRGCFKHYPLVSIHGEARLASQAAAAADLQQKFWAMHDRLFENQKRLSRADLVEHARAAGLAVDRFEQDLDSEAVARRVERDRIEAHFFRIRGTPTFVVNGFEMLDPPDVPDLLDAVEEALLRAPAEKKK
jgi:Na+:H+ antiporter, NhaA family